MNWLGIAPAILNSVVSHTKLADSPASDGEYLPNLPSHYRLLTYRRMLHLTRSRVPFEATTPTGATDADTKWTGIYSSH